MATTIVTKNSSTASAVPTAGQLVQGELAVNVADKKLYTEDNAGSIIVLADGVKLAGIEALADVTDTANVTAAGALMDSELTNITAVKALNQGVATTDSPSFVGLTATTADINGGTIDGTTIGATTPASVAATTGTFSSTVTATGTSVFASLDISGDIDVDGTTNLDVVDIDGAVDMASTLGVTGVATLASLVATTADINAGTIDGTVIGGSTAAAGTFTTVTASGDVTLSGGTANGVAFANGSKVLTTGSALTFDGTNTVTLNASAANLTLGISTNYGLVTATGTNPASIYFNGGSRTGFESHLQYFGANHTFFNETGGSEIMRLLNTGNVGIGTSSPSAALDVTGIIKSASATQSSLYLSNAARTNGFLIGRSLSSNDAQDLFIYDTVAASTRLSIDSSGNVGIGTSSPATKVEISGTGFQTLSITSTNSSPVLKLNSAASSTAFLQWNNAGSSPLSFYDLTASSERMRIDASGNVGIGTSSVSTTLHLKDTRATLRLEPEAIGGTTFDMRNGVSGVTEGGMSFYDVTNSATRLVIDSSGNVDIGLAGKTSSTTVKVENASGYAPTLVLNQSGIGAASIAVPASVNALQFNYFDGSSLTEAMRIDGSGNLLVGCTSAGASNGVTLHSSGYIQPRTNTGIPAIYADREGSDGSIIELRKDGTAVGSIGAGSSELIIGTADTGLRFYDFGDAIIPRSTSNGTRDATTDLGASGNRFKDLYLSGNINLSASSQINSSTAFYLDSDIIHFRRNNETESARIDSSGNLLVGTTDTVIWNDTSGEGVVIGPNAIQVARASDTCLLLNRQSTDGLLQVFASRGVQVGSISVDVSSTAYNTSSDQRLKENITDANDAGDKIDAIKVRQYDWKVNGSHQDYGMIAQELLEVAPEAVHQPEDSEEMMGVDYSKLVPMLIKEIQSLRNRVAQLEGI